MDAYIGHVEGVPLGSFFRNRQALRDAGIHRTLQAGIDYSKVGACSVVVSGGYVDDFDGGDEIIYTGHGGNDPATKRQVKDQEWHRGNAALRKNQHERLPVRVCRGHRGDPEYSPQEGYRYDGLYLVAESWGETGVDGFRICRFHLVEANHLVPDQDRGAKPLQAQKPPAAPPPTPDLLRGSPKEAILEQHLHDAPTHLLEPGHAQDWVAELLIAPAFARQRSALAATLPAARIQQLIAWLDANGGRLTHTDLAGALKFPARRIGGLVATLSRVLNLDGYEVLSDDGAMVRLDANLARAQFGVGTPIS